MILYLTMRVIYQSTFIFFLLVGQLFSFSQDEIYCDWHDAKAYYDKTVYRNGKCFKLYYHSVWKDGERYRHTLTVLCS
jgi:hypothetical protein